MSEFESVARAESNCHDQFRFQSHASASAKAIVNSAATRASSTRRGGVFDGQRRWWVEAYLSPDRGQSWYRLAEPVIENSGNPATLTRLGNGDLALTYGWRRAPYGIRGRLSRDGGQTWSDEFVLTADGASWDLGYPRTVQRADGKCVTIYYHHTSDQPERFIACTIWEPSRRR